MREERDPGTIIQAAEKAAEAGNYVSAEDLLREAARLQEASLGPRHPDLANTLNNLGIVCEITGKSADAEQYFRRAVSIARTSLPPDHPFVTTSQKNLREFCETRGKQVEEPAETRAKPVPPVTAVEAEAVPAVAVDPETPPPIDPEPEDPEATSRKFFTRLAFGALGPIAMLMVVLAVGLPRLGAPELNAPLPTAALDSQPPVAPAQAPADVEPAPTPEETPAVAEDDADDASATAVEPARAVETVKAVEPVPTIAAASAVTSSSTSARPVIVRASLCGDLDDWSCDPADRPVPPGPLFFYTQITSTDATTIQHRWYRDNHLQQTVDLRVQPTRTGYRTYSRHMIKSESAGNWRVEVRSKDGALLHEERFTVH
jgi:hypothetical protein